MAELQRSPWRGWDTVRMIGRGSFGTVYEIQRKLVDGTVESAAMKVITLPQNPSDVEELYGEGMDEESITATFESHLKSIVSEYTLMQKLDNSVNVVNCKDICYIHHDDGIGWDIYIRMELLTPLLKALPSDISEQTAVKVGRDICSALVLCQKYNIIHRDIKPQNIFVSSNGDYKLGDFGIAKTVEGTMGGTKIGTYKYMAPEVYNNQPYGSASDIYSLGLVLYWLLNERRMPFMPLPPAKILATQDEHSRLRRLTGEAVPPPAHGSKELKKIVLKACAYDPKERYHSAAAMLADLNALNGERTSNVNVAAPATEKNRGFRPNDGADDANDATVLADMSLNRTAGTRGTIGKARSNTVEKTGSAAFGKTGYAPIEKTTSGTVAPSGKAAVQDKEIPPQKPRERKEKGPKSLWPIAVAAAVVCIVGGIYGYTHCWFGHVWGEATCTEPAVCVRCGKVGEEAPGHDWKAADCTTPQTCERCGETSGEALGHSWKKADCTEPKTCERCGETSGTVLGHNWKAATCTEPETCSRCGMTKGTPLGHTWQAATFLTSQTCSVCGATEGGPLTAPKIVSVVPEMQIDSSVKYNSKEGKLYFHDTSIPNYKYNADQSDLATPGYIGNATDAKGNTYQYGFHVGGPRNEPHWVTIRLDGKYKNFTAVCAPSSSAKNGGSKVVRFFCDNETAPRYETSAMRYSSSPVSIQFDITGVQVLKILYSEAAGANDLAVLYDAKCQ